ncbi:hypothetical protein [Nocardia cyriacigeorgica]|uniref:hypothetical protein n=1 Tax=Nocardia cyriacigeorgica TaxID=135487 RepID=UPI0024565DFA|nr:hypothetical protein [Nocardia cyriacigeorgica]
MDAVSAPAREEWQKAQDAFRLNWQGREDAFASVLNGQAALSNRMELLQASGGFASGFMAHNWSVSPSTRVTIPFDRVLGPTKNAGVVAPSGDQSGWLVLKAGGLWRVDAHVTASGFTENVTFIPIPNPPYVITQYTYDPIAPHFRMEVFNGAGDIWTTREFFDVPNYALYDQGTWAPVAYPFSVAFNHTFVLEDMPPPDDPTAPDHWAYVRLTLAYTPINSSGQLTTQSQCKLQGGTKWSSLIASRWSRDDVNNLYVPTVPDGGRLE